MDSSSNKPTIKNCCLGHYRIVVDEEHYCMIADLVHCDNRGKESGKDGLFPCNIQDECHGECHGCHTYHNWMASGVPAEEWVDIQ